MNSRTTANEPLSTNLTPLARGSFLWRAIAALASGLMLSCSFPPLNWSIMAWFALVPIMLVPTPRRKIERLAVGFILGYAHFATALHWLNEVGFYAGYLLAVYCAFFPMLWYFIISTFNWRLKDKQNAVFPGAGPLFIADEWMLILHILIQAAVWVWLEYMRSMLFSGFPWDLVGISQFRRLAVAGLAQFTGVYGVSFIIILANAIIAAELSRQFRMFLSPSKRQFPWHFALMTLALVPICILQAKKEFLPPDGTPNIRIAALQGNIPLMREWTEEQYEFALNTYISLSEKAAADYSDLDLLLWPETAVPAPLGYPPFKAALLGLQQKIKKPILMGVLRVMGNEEESYDFNSAVLLDEDSHVVEAYNKMHLVPFGEFTPGSSICPFLTDLFGMGRDLTHGKEEVVFKLAKGARAGVNICFEDVFPSISREFTLKGSNILMTITNDSWYNRSSGSEQHLSHAVYRAIENRRPLLRSGNNSHTCLITPNGATLGIVDNKDDGSPFVRSCQAYDVPVYDEWGTTFYTRHGDLFAQACTIPAIALLFYLIVNKFMHHRQNLEKRKKA